MNADDPTTRHEISDPPASASTSEPAHRPAVRRLGRHRGGRWIVPAAVMCAVLGVSAACAASSSATATSPAVRHWDRGLRVKHLHHRAEFRSSGVKLGWIAPRKPSNITGRAARVIRPMLWGRGWGCARRADRGVPSSPSAQAAFEPAGPEWVTSTLAKAAPDQAASSTGTARTSSDRSTPTPRPPTRWARRRRAARWSR
jgi:hypothetical protein